MIADRIVARIELIGSNPEEHGLVSVHAAGGNVVLWIGDRVYPPHTLDYCVEVTEQCSRTPFELQMMLAGAKP